MRKHFILFMIICGPLMVDVMNGILMPDEASVSIGQLIRGAYIAVPLFLMIFGKNLKQNLIPLLVLIFLVIRYAVILCFVNDSFALHMEISILMKVAYPFLVTYLVTQYKIINDRVEPNDLLIQAALYSSVISLGVLSGYVFDLHKTYGAYSFGRTGIFLSPNDPGIGLVVSSAAAAWLLLKGKGFWSRIPYLLTLAAGVTLGSRTAIAGVFLAPAILFVGSFFASDISKLKLGGLLFITLLPVALVAQYVINVIKLDPYMLNKFTTLVEGQHPHELIYRVGLMALEERSWLVNFVGEGVTPFMHRVQRLGPSLYSPSPWGKRVEVDWIDMTGFYGWGVMVFMYACYIYMLVKAVGRFMFTRYSAYMAVMVGMMVFIVHSLMAGHAMFSPIPGGAIAPLMAFLLIHRSREPNSEQVDG